MANLSEYPGAAEGDLTGAPVQPEGDVYVPAVHEATPIKPLTLPQGLYSTAASQAHGSETGLRIRAHFKQIRIQHLKTNLGFSFTQGWKKPGFFLKKTQPSGFFVFFGFFWIFGFFAQTRGF
jgi:hypothetical protein